MNPSYLSCVAYELGAPTAISSIPKLAPQDLDRLGKLGLEQYSTISTPLLEVIRKSIESTLEKFGKPQNVDAIILSTQSFESLICHESKISSICRSARESCCELFVRLGFVGVPVFCTTFGGSSNFIQALQIANSLVLSHDYNSILMVFADKIGNGSERFMSDAIAVVGDGVATCILSTTKNVENNFELEHAAVLGYDFQPECVELSEKALVMYRATKIIAADCYEAVGRHPDQYDWLVLNNYNRTTNTLFGKLLGFLDENVFSSNLNRTGHVPACDTLINLASIAPNFDREEKVMCLVNGPISCGVASFSRESK